MKCKHEKSRGYEICTMEECCDYEKSTMTNADIAMVRNLRKRIMGEW
jgi:hypothetical protein